MDFLSAKLGRTAKIDLGKVEGREYFVEVKALSKGDMAACLSKLRKLRLQVDLDGNAKNSAGGELSYDDYMEEMVCRSIVSWNIDGPEGVLPFSPLEKARESYRRLPNEVADQIFQICDELNAPPSKEEDARFRDGNASGAKGTRKVSRSGRAAQLPDGENALEESGVN